MLGSIVYVYEWFAFMYMCVCAIAMCVPGARGDQKKVAALELAL